MKKKIAALILAMVLAFPVGNATVYGTENTVPLSVTETTEAGVSGATGTVDDSGADSAGTETTETIGAGSTTELSTETTDNAAEGTVSGESTGGTESVASTETESEVSSEQSGAEEAVSTEIPEKFKEHLTLPGFSYHDGKLWYQDAELDENGCYSYTDADGKKLLFNSLDPEFPDTYSAIKKNAGKTSSDEVKVSSSALGANTGDIYAGLNNTLYAHPAGANGRDVLHGIDVSSHQGDINWVGMKQSGVKFAIIRSGARGYGAAGGFIDDTSFTTNMVNASAQGMKIGVYFFSQAISEEEAIAEADRCYTEIMNSGYRNAVSLPVYIDYEYVAGGRLANARLSAAQHTAICNAFCARMNAYGFASGIYANKDMLTSDMLLSGIPANYSIWMANWQNVTDYTGRLDCWQYHVSTALGNWVSNVTKTVDLDFGYWADTSLTATAKANPATLSLDTSKTDYVETTLTATANKSASTFSWSIAMSDGTSAAGAYTQTTPVTNNLTNTSTLRFTKPGTYKATVTVTKGSEKTTATVTITVKAALQEDWFSAQSATFPYDGKEHVIKDLIKTTAKAPNGTAYFNVYYQKKTVTKLTDVLRDANGTVIPYEVTIEGTGACTGTLTRKVLVTPRNISGGDCVITIPEIQEYVPSMNALQMTVVDNGIYTTDKNNVKIPKTLVCGTDYEVENADQAVLGTVYVTVDGIGNYAGSLRSTTPVELESAYLSDGMIAAIPDQYFTGEALTPKATISQAGITLTEGEDYTLSYANNINLGKATVTATGMGNYTGSASATFQIKAKPLTEDMLLEIPDQIYTGAPVKLDLSETPILRNTVTQLPLTLTTNNKDGDFKIAYAGNINIGTATVTLTGLNNYSGTIKGQFAIKRADIGGEDVTILLANTEEYEAAYTGKEIKPAVKVMRNGKAVAASNYTITYANNKDVGEASVLLTGKGSFEGTAEASFTITPKPLTQNGKAGAGISFGTITAKTYSSKESQGMKPLPVVKYSGVALTEGADYRISYDKIKTNEKGAIVYDAARKMEVEEDGLDAITETGTYRAVLIAEDGNFEGEYAYPSVFKVNPAKIAAKNVIMKNDALREGDTDPGIEVWLDGVILGKGTEYSVTYLLGRAEYDAPSVPGRYTVRVDGLGNYQGRVTQTLTVYDASTTVFNEAGFDVELPADFDYSFDNTLKKPAVTVTNRNTGALLTLNKDYTVTYAENKNVGTATAKVTGKGSYKGVIAKTFTITPCVDASITGDVNKLSFGVNKGSFVFNGRVQKATPVVKLMTADPKTGKAKAVATLRNGVDYTAEYEDVNSRDAGEYDITLTMKGNYEGEETVTYEIAPYEVSRLAVTIPTQPYDGTEKEPQLSDMTIRCGGVVMTDEDKEGLTITYYANNVNVGTKAQVTIEAESSGNFTNQRVERSGNTELPKLQYFTIQRRTMADKTLIFTVGDAYVSEKNVSDYEATYEEKRDANGEKRVAVAQEPEVEITDSQGNVLQEGVDYKLSYSANKNVGKNASVTVTGLNGYTGSRRITFAIVGKPLTGYTTMKLYKTAAGAKEEDAADKVTDETYVYSGTQYKPIPYVEYQDPVFGTTGLTSGTDYTIQYVDNLNAGEATVRLVGKGRYQGTLEETFQISPLTASYLAENKKTVVISNIPTQYYTGKVIVPNVTVTAGGRKLVKGKDYTLDVTNSVVLNENQTALLKVNGIGNYKGMLAKKEFPIVLQKPAAPTLSSSNGWIQVSWKAVPGATGYCVETASRADFNDLTGFDVNSTTDNVTISGNTWTYKLRAKKNTTRYIRLTSVSKVKKENNGVTREVRIESDPSQSKSIIVK